MVEQTKQETSRADEESTRAEQTEQGTTRPKQKTTSAEQEITRVEQMEQETSRADQMEIKPIKMEQEIITVELETMLEQRTNVEKGVDLVSTVGSVEQKAMLEPREQRVQGQL